MSVVSNDSPVAVFEYWPVKAAVWQNRAADGRISYSYTVKRSYRHPTTDEWRDSTSFYKEHGMALTIAIADCCRWIATEGRQRLRSQSSDESNSQEN